MLKVLFTLDYEIHGTGEGSPYKLIVEPTDRMLEQFDKYGAKLTILADVGEIIKFKEYYEKTNNDKFYYHQIVEQLQRAVKNGHDVQLHIHSSYLKSEFSNGRWNQHWDEYSLATLKYTRLYEIINQCKSFLSEILKPVKPDYECFAFRAANWSMIPTGNIAKALIDNDITIDTSVFKYGKRKGRVSFDYTNAYSDTIPWPANLDNVCEKDEESPLLEFPIYSENKSIWNFITLNRLYRILQASNHKHPKFTNRKKNTQKTKVSKLSKYKRILLEKQALKLDFNQCTGRQMIKTLNSIKNKYSSKNVDIPVVLIGHSKLFTKFNEISISPFLKYIKNNSDKYQFAVFNDFDLSKYYSNKKDILEINSI